MRAGPVLVAVMEGESAAVMQSLEELVISTCPLVNDRTPLIILHALIGDSQPLHLIISAGNAHVWALVWNVSRLPVSLEEPRRRPERSAPINHHK